MNTKIANVLHNILLPDNTIALQTQNFLDNLTKPQGSLGELEEICKKIAVISGISKPIIAKKFVFVFAADHGIAEENISAYPQQVTSQMVLNFLKGGAAINVFAKFTNTELLVIDIGVKNSFNFAVNVPYFINKNINFGTKNFLKQPAMSKEEAEKGILCGIEIVEEVLLKHQKKDNEVFLIAIGDMGIGNTTTASAITAVITGVEPHKVVGKGTGVDELRLRNKISIVKTVLEKYKFNLNDGIDLLSKIGGYEIAGMVGVILACARYKIPVVLDGFISTSAALVASCFDCKIIKYLLAGHLSEEPGHKVQLEFLGLKPILNLNMRLGEGTGACLAMNVIELSCKILNEMATFDKAGVSKKL